MEMEDYYTWDIKWISQVFRKFESFNMLESKVDNAALTGKFGGKRKICPSPALCWALESLVISFNQDHDLALLRFHGLVVQRLPLIQL